MQNQFIATAENAYVFVIQKVGVQNQKISGTGRDPQGPPSPTHDSTQDYLKMKPYF